MKKNSLFIVCCLAVFFATFGCNEDNCNDSCSSDEICLSDKCRTECDDGDDCLNRHGGGWLCVDGGCVPLTEGVSHTTTPPDGDVDPVDNVDNAPPIDGDVDKVDLIDEDPPIVDGDIDMVDDDVDVVEVSQETETVEAEIIEELEAEMEISEESEMEVEAEAELICRPGDSEVCTGNDLGQCQTGYHFCTAEGDWSECLGVVGPSAEVCDGLDNDCDGEADNGFQLGFPCMEIASCGIGVWECDGNGGRICSVMPGGSEDASHNEICDGIDNDCDGITDEDFDLLTDVNNCGSCGNRCLVGGAYGYCEEGSCHYNCQLNFYDLDEEPGCEYFCATTFGGLEKCDGFDNDCDGEIDEGCDCQLGEPQDCGPQAEFGLCRFGTQICQIDGSWGECRNAILPQLEVCDGLDNDCDGEADEDFQLEFPCQAEGVCGIGVWECNASGGRVCSTAPMGSADASSVEVCDGEDNDCDGVIDEGFDLQNDVGNCGSCGNVCQRANADASCQSGQCVYTCQQDYYNYDNEPGCEYYCVQTHLGQERCDGLDNNCDGVIDENCGCTFGEAPQSCGASNLSICQFGTQTCQFDGTWGDCVGSIDPVEELCDGIDNDCDGSVDETYEVGYPCQGKGVCGVGVWECADDGSRICSTMPGGSADESSAEVCDGLDNDCDGVIDEEFAVGTSCDGIGECGLGVWECSSTGDRVCSTDVGGTQDSAIVESCDGLDNDCDGEIDENYWVGLPCVGIGVCVEGIWECNGLDDHICSTMPTASADMSTLEKCDGVDNDCDGEVDEDFAIGEICNVIGTGQCGPGVWECAGETSRICSTMPGGSVDQSSAEVCDGVDNDCDGIVPDTEVDNDNDGMMICQGDCDDNVAEVYLGKMEICDGFDNDCDGNIDETFYIGVPCRGLGQCGLGVFECDGFYHYICSTRPGRSEDMSSPEYCEDNIDNDCDGLVDGYCQCNTGDVRQCGSNVGQCSFGTQTCVDGRWGECIGVVGPSDVEVCDGLDNDCDGNLPLNEQDLDQDGEMSCEGDCNDNDSAINSSAIEFCDGIDNDCDGEIDEDFDIGKNCRGIGICGEGVWECNGLNDHVCSTMPGASADMSSVEVCMDLIDNDCNGQVNETCQCNDIGSFTVCGTTDVGECDFGFQECQSDGTFGTCSSIEPVVEICDTLDNDCDGAIDEDFDLQSDINNCGSCNNSCTALHGTADCQLGSCIVTSCDDGYWDNDGLSGCEYQCYLTAGGAEQCDGIDNDCDGAIDEDFVDDGGVFNQSVQHCGACNNSCGNLPQVDGVSCSLAGTCQIDSCESGYTDEDGLVDNGCENMLNPTYVEVECCYAVGVPASYGQFSFSMWDGTNPVSWQNFWDLSMDVSMCYRTQLDTSVVSNNVVYTDATAQPADSNPTQAGWLGDSYAPTSCTVDGVSVTVGQFVDQRGWEIPIPIL